MKEFNMDLFQQKNENLERLIINAEKAIESKESKDYIYLLSCYKQYILVNLEFGHIRQILLKVIELNENIINLNIKDADCFIAFAQLLAFIKGFGEGYKEKKKILNLFIYNYETAKMLKPNNSQIILDFCYHLEGFAFEAYSKEDSQRKCFRNNISLKIKYIYKVLYENYSQANLLNALDYHLYSKYIILMDYYFFNCTKYYPKYIAVKIAELLKTKIFPNHNIFKNIPELNDILFRIFDYLSFRCKYFDNEARLLICSVIESFENSPVSEIINEDTLEVYNNFITGIISTTAPTKDKVFWDESLLYVEKCFNKIMKSKTNNEAFKNAYESYCLFYFYYARLIKDDYEKYKILVKTRDLYREGLELYEIDSYSYLQRIYKELEIVENNIKKSNLNKGAAENV